MNSGFPISTLEYTPYTPGKDCMSTCVLAGFATLVVFLVLSKPSSPMYYPPAYRTGMQITSMVAKVGDSVGARISNAATPKTSNMMPAAKSKTTTGIPPTSKVSVIDASNSVTDKDAHKTMTEDEKAKCHQAALDFVKKNTTGVVMFFAPWCPHCHSAMPDFSAAADTTDHPFVMINAEALPPPAFTGPDALFALEYFPSFAVISGDKLVKSQASSPAELIAEAAKAARPSCSKQKPWLYSTV